MNTAAAAGLIDRELAEQAGAAYRRYRRFQHNAKLRDAAEAAAPALSACYRSVRSLWAQVFGAEAGTGGA